MRHLGWLLAPVLVLVGCGDDDDAGSADAASDGGGMADAAPDAPTCVYRWERRRLVMGAQAEARIESGALVLRASNLADGVPLLVRQIGLSANFDATFDFEAFSAGGAGAFARAVLTDEDLQGTSTFRGGFLSLPAASIVAERSPQGPSDVKPVGATSGSVRLSKTGNSITVTTTAGGMTSTTQGFYGVTPLGIGIELGSAGAAGPIVAETMVRISNFSITGGGGRVLSDDFSCDSLR